MRFIVLSVFVGLVGCDLNEGPAEETREANEAILDGDRPGEIRDQIEDIGQKRDGVAVDPDLDRDLRDAEQWADRQRKSIDDGTRKADENLDREVNEIQRDLKKIRADVDRLGEKPDGERDTLRTSLREQLRELSLKIDKLDGEVDDQPGKDPIGPG